MNWKEGSSGRTQPTILPVNCLYGFARACAKSAGVRSDRVRGCGQLGRSRRAFLVAQRDHFILELAAALNPKQQEAGGVVPARPCLPPCRFRPKR